MLRGTLSIPRGDAVQPSKEPMRWTGVSNACSTTWALIAFFPTEPGGLDEAVVGRVVWDDFRNWLISAAA